MDLFLEVLVHRHVGHFHAVATHVELPAVVHAADAAFLVAPKEQRSTAVRAAVIEDAYAALAVTEGEQLLTEQHQPHRIAVGLHFGGHRRGHPVLAHELAHHRARPHAGQVGTVIRLDHLVSLCICDRGLKRNSLPIRQSYF